MPQIMTANYHTSIFFVPYCVDKTEGVWVRPLSLTTRNMLRRKAAQEAGCDAEITESLLCRFILEECIVDWKGFRDVKGCDIPYNKEILRDLCEYDQVAAANLLSRVLEVARMGEIDDQKN